MPSLRHSIFFERFRESREYLELTAYATARAILKRAHGGEYVVTVLVDGLKRQEIPAFTRGLRDLRIQTRKVRGVRKEENDAFIRLVDAICGLVRDAYEENEWAVALLGRMKAGGLVAEL